MYTVIISVVYSRDALLTFKVDGSAQSNANALAGVEQRFQINLAPGTYRLGVTASADGVNSEEGFVNVTILPTPIVALVSVTPA